MIKMNTELKDRVVDLLWKLYNYNQVTVASTSLSDTGVVEYTKVTGAAVPNVYVFAIGSVEDITDTTEFIDLYVLLDLVGHCSNVETIDGIMNIPQVLKFNATKVLDVLVELEK